MFNRFSRGAQSNGNAPQAVGSQFSRPPAPKAEKKLGEKLPLEAASNAKQVAAFMKTVDRTMKEVYRETKKGLGDYVRMPQEFLLDCRREAGDCKGLKTSFVTLEGKYTNTLHPHFKKGEPISILGLVGAIEELFTSHTAARVLSRSKAWQSLKWGEKALGFKLSCDIQAHEKGANRGPVIIQFAVSSPNDGVAKRITTCEDSTRFVQFVLEGKDNGFLPDTFGITRVGEEVYFIPKPIGEVAPSGSAAKRFMLFPRADNPEMRKLDRLANELSGIAHALK